MPGSALGAGDRALNKRDTNQSLPSWSFPLRAGGRPKQRNTDGCARLEWVSGENNAGVGVGGWAVRRRPESDGEGCGNFQ